MHISFSSLLMSLIFGNIFLGILMFVIRRDNQCSRYNINFIITSFMLILLRFALPVEFNFTKTIACKKILPHVQQNLYVPIGGSHVTAITVLVWIWGIIACLKLILFISSYLKTHQLISSVKTSQDDIANNILDDICKNRHCRQKFRIIQISACKSPFILGLLHPIIVLPQMKLDQTELEFILRHETEHYFHHDLLKKFVIEILCIIYWWNPAIYILKKELNNMFELFSDEIVVDQLNEQKRIEYLECLLKIAKKNKVEKIGKYSLAFCRAGTTANLEHRFNFILNRHKTSKNKYHSFVFCVFSGMIMLISFSFILESYRMAPEVEQTTFSITSENAYILVQDNDYYICVEGMPAVHVQGIKDSYADLPVYIWEKDNEKN